MSKKINFKLSTSDAEILLDLLENYSHGMGNNEEGVEPDHERLARFLNQAMKRGSSED